jgi:hypothetical protein
MFDQIKDGGARESGRMNRDGAMATTGGAVISWKIIEVSDTVGAEGTTGVVWEKRQSGQSALLPVSASL